MSSADFWAYFVVGMGGAGAVMFAVLTWKARKRAHPVTRLLGAGIALVCAYPAVLWGAQLAGWLVITPLLVRPALAMALTALVCLGIMAFGQKPQ